MAVIEPLPSLYSTNPNNLPSNWNKSVPVGYGSGAGKPDLQQFFLTQSNLRFGTMNTQSAWAQFLNYYMWMQANLDYQIGRILFNDDNSLKNFNGGAFYNNTVIIFTSDHGDLAGSHGLHGKGGPLYDEIINVPLYISFPNATLTGRQTSSVPRSFVCASVDLLPFLYTLALGNDSWRCNSLDPIYYLRHREAITDAIFKGPTTQRRVSSIRCANPNPNNQAYQPYILHTCDEPVRAFRSTGRHAQPCDCVSYGRCDGGIRRYSELPEDPQ